MIDIANAILGPAVLGLTLYAIGRAFIVYVWNGERDDG